jgi:hypothetical protein
MTEKPERSADAKSPEQAANIELLAIEEHFVAEHEAGQHPRLSAYLQHYPTHAEALTGFVAEYLSAAASPEEAGDVGRVLSPGIQSALDAIFGAREDERRVAERREGYSLNNADEQP